MFLSVKLFTVKLVTLNKKIMVWIRNISTMDPVHRVFLFVKINPNNLPVGLLSSLLTVPHGMMDVRPSPEKKTTKIKF